MTSHNSCKRTAIDGTFVILRTKQRPSMNNDAIRLRTGLGISAPIVYAGGRGLFGRRGCQNPFFGQSVGVFRTMFLLSRGNADVRNLLTYLNRRNAPLLARYHRSQLENGGKCPSFCSPGCFDRRFERDSEAASLEYPLQRHTCPLRRGSPPRARRASANVGYA